ncbi:carbohydrate-binding protein [Micrococcus lylae]|uniref:Chitin-binding type-3 domain-containing protein n=1 Tax=Micrococcus lylae TaxID=1273 RepID=A0ABY2K2P3_9MICC|nr:carbohydrate-binding protein [Micrococcus lylae]TFI01624.1 hypothetical protein E4A49_00995 [Micrococcus lylae]
MPATLPDLTDTETWTDDDLDALRVAVLTEQERRYVLATAEARAEQTARQYRDAVEAALPPLAEGEHRAWFQLTGGHDAYPRGAVVAHGGKVWESEHPANVWEPGGIGVDDRLWVDVTEDAPDPEPVPDAPEFKAGEQVKPGDFRTYNGTIYRCLQAHTTADHWAPDVAPSLWTVA